MSQSPEKPNLFDPSIAASAILRVKMLGGWSVLRPDFNINMLKNKSLSNSLLCQKRCGQREIRLLYLPGKKKIGLGAMTFFSLRECVQHHKIVPGRRRRIFHISHLSSRHRRSGISVKRRPTGISGKVCEASLPCFFGFTAVCDCHRGATVFA